MNTCETCGAHFSPRQTTKANRFCSPSCYHVFPRTKRAGIEHRLQRSVGHPLAPASGIVATARIVLYDKIGPGPHPCHWCGEQIEWKVGAGPVRGAILADHLNFDRTDDSPGNLVPACSACNSHRTKKGDRRRIRDDELVIVLSNGQRTRAVEVICEVCDTTFLTTPAFRRKGKGRFCSFECGRLGMKGRKHF